MSKKISIVAIFAFMSSSVVFSMNHDDASALVQADNAVTQNIIQTGRFAGLTENQADAILSQESKEKREATKAQAQVINTALIQQQQTQFPPFGRQLNFD